MRIKSKINDIHINYFDKKIDLTTRNKQLATLERCKKLYNMNGESSYNVLLMRLLADKKQEEYNILTIAEVKHICGD